MPQWAGSCWYYLRFLDPKNPDRLVDPAKEKFWMPVDLYVGGAEHAVLHLLYARFWHKVLFDIGVVSTPEPFMKLVHQGTILGEDNRKMSKSWGNVVSPDDMVDEYGADAMRIYEMFMGPLEAMKPWSTSSVEGISRFLDRVWRLYTREDGSILLDDTAVSPEMLRVLHQTIRKVTEDLDALKFNTAIAQMMVFVNEVMKQPARPRALLEPFVLVLSPFAPHLGEELWARMGHRESLAYAPWPKFDPALCEEDTVTVAVQVNGKLRATLDLPEGRRPGGGAGRGAGRRAREPSPEWRAHPKSHPREGQAVEPRRGLSARRRRSGGARGGERDPDRTRPGHRRSSRATQRSPLHPGGASGPGRRRTRSSTRATGSC
jgi:leucyl-tRNA synthetase